MKQAKISFKSQSPAVIRDVQKRTAEYLATLPVSNEADLPQASTDTRVKAVMVPDKYDPGVFRPALVYGVSKPTIIEGTFIVRVYDGKTLLAEVETKMYGEQYQPGEVVSRVGKALGFYPIEGLTATVESQITRWETPPAVKGGF